MGAVTATITNEGDSMPTEYELLTVDVVKEVNRIPYAKLRLVDGDAPEQNYPISDGSFFDLGSKIDIKLRYESKATEEDLVFKGIVIKQSIKSDSRGSYLEVELRDPAIKMTSVRRSIVYQEQSDDAIIKDIVGLYEGVKVGKVDKTTPVHKETVQYYSSDWDYMLNRADVNGLFVTCNDGEISVTKPEITAAKHEFKHGVDDIFEMEMEVSSRKQYKEVQSTGWSITDQKMVKTQSGTDYKLKQSKLKPTDLSKVMNIEPYTLVTAVPEEEAALKSWADSMMIKTRFSMLRGRVSTYGNPKVKLGESISIQGIGDKFNGTTLITGIRHRVNVKGWYTDIQFGLTDKWFSHREGIDEEPASGLTPSVNGLHIGIVDAFEEDKDKINRVRVKLPAIAELESVWARMSHTDAGKERGCYFYPEKDDEVIVGFINDDPRHAIILGSLHNAKNKPPFVTDAKNIEKGIVTKMGSKLVLNDDLQTITIQTSDGNKVFLDEKNKMIDILDLNKNQITMDKNGIKLKSAKDLNLEASGNVVIKGSKVDVK